MWNSLGGKVTWVSLGRLVGSGGSLVGGGGRGVGSLTGVGNIGDVTGGGVSNGVGHGLDSAVGKVDGVAAAGGVAVSVLTGLELGAGVVVSNGVVVGVDGGADGLSGVGAVGWGRGGGGGSGDEGGSKSKSEHFVLIWGVGVARLSEQCEMMTFDQGSPLFILESKHIYTLHTYKKGVSFFFSHPYPFFNPCSISLLGCILLQRIISDVILRPTPVSLHKD